MYPQRRHGRGKQTVGEGRTQRRMPGPRIGDDNDHDDVGVEVGDRRRGVGGGGAKAPQGRCADRAVQITDLIVGGQGGANRRPQAAAVTTAASSAVAIGTRRRVSG
jgi:hypothetical protein